MAKWPIKPKKTIRTDKKRNLAKVAKIVLKDPLLTEREIAKKTNIWKSTVNRMKQELGQDGAKDDRIVGLTDEDFEIQKIIQAEKRKRLETPEKINNKDLDTWDNSAMKRYTLFRGNATNKEWWLVVNTISFSDIDGDIHSSQV